MPRTQRPEPCFHLGLRPPASPPGTPIAPANPPGRRLSHRRRPITNTATATTTTRPAPSAMSSAINMACPPSRLAAGTLVA